jgi:DNA polymerase-4
VILKVKFDDFSVVTRSHTVDFGIDDDEAVARIAVHLVDEVPPFHGGVRLCGVACSSLEDGDASVQLAFSLDDPVDARRLVDLEARHRQGDLAALRAAVDEVRRRHGTTAVATAAELGPDGVAVEPRRRENAWGPGGDASRDGTPDDVAS